MFRPELFCMKLMSDTTVSLIKSPTTGFLAKTPLSTPEPWPIRDKLIIYKKECQKIEV
jgi:hypothetical protein